MSHHTDLLRRGFSLAELMIALVILGLGLLFIAATLPVGVNYARETAEQGLAEAAGQSALDSIELMVRTSSRLHGQNPPPPAVGTTFTRIDSLFRPRKAGAAPAGGVVFDAEAEPFIKVRPLIGRNIDMRPDAWPRYAELPDSGEAFLSVSMPAVLASIGITTNLERQLDVLPAVVTPPTLPAVALADYPALPSVVRAYPPISADIPFSATAYGGPGAYFSAPSTPSYVPRPVYSPDVLPPTPATAETRKLTEQRFVWTAFYRRVAYDKMVPSATGTPATVREANDPLVYEFVVVVCRRPTLNHRFARQNAVVGGGLFSPFREPQALAPAVAGAESLFPEPWLVAFTGVPTPTEGAGGYRYAPSPTLPLDRVLYHDHVMQATLHFTCTPEVGALLPVGSVIIPAVNDFDARGVVSTGGGELAYVRHVGFVPHVPDTLPIYEVVERPDRTTVVVKGNGVYPWVNPATGGVPELLLSWVVPPAFVERSGGQPVFDRRASVVSVVRRVIRVPEVP
jgi:prepilin-type N-terminal cleavage/methylation domain-containing protein